MFSLRCGSRSATIARPFSSLRHYTTHRRSRLHIPPPFPVVDTCPSPTCACRPAPDGLDIDRAHPLNGTMAAYAEQVLVSTGRDDWPSRIEEEQDALFARELKGLLGRGGKFLDPYHNVMITNSSFKPAKETPLTEAVSAYLLPSFRFVPEIPTERSKVEAFVRGFVLPEHPNKANNVLPPAMRKALRRDLAAQAEFPDVRDVNEILVLICGHGGRDQRCGIMGPLLRSEFEDQLQRERITVSHEPSASSEQGSSAESQSNLPTAKVGLISHIGGHKYAGNVIIYIPPSFTQNPLAGKGIWYGRVDPEHVEGIVKETILEGKVIRNMFRGGIERGGHVLRL